MLQDKTSLRNVNTKDLTVGSTHLVWTSLPSNVADCIELNVCDHASIPIYEMTNSLNLVNWFFRIQCSAEHLVSICSMSSKLKNIMLQSMELCYKMHVHRVWKIKDYE
jgi:hypothetical protein